MAQSGHNFVVLLRNHWSFCHDDMDPTRDWFVPVGRVRATGRLAWCGRRKAIAQHHEVFLRWKGRVY